MGAGRQGGRNDGSDITGFDSAVSGAWGVFERNLAAHITDMPRGAYITLTSAQASPGQRGQRPYIDVVAVGNDRLLGIAALPSYLYPDTSELSDLDLHLMGWTQPGKPAVDGTVIDYVQGCPRSDASALAASVVATFTLLWNLPHPSFLSAWAVGATDAESGPVHLGAEIETSDATRQAMPSADALPEELRSLHTFCQVLGGAVRSETVASVCGTVDLDDLGERALDHARRCARYAAELREIGETSASKVWKQQARSWFYTARSIRTASRRVSHPDRPSQSAGS